MSEVVLDDDHHAYLRGYPYPTRSEILALRTLGGLTQPGEEVDLDAEFATIVEAPAPGFTPLEHAGVAVAISQGIDKAAVEKWRLLQERNTSISDFPAEMVSLHHQGLHVVIGSAVALAARRSQEVPDNITDGNLGLLESLRSQESAAFPVLDAFYPDSVIMNACVIGYSPTAAYEDFTSVPSRLGLFYQEWLEGEHQRMTLGGVTDNEWDTMQLALTAGMSTGFELFQAAYEYRN